MADTSVPSVSVEQLMLKIKADVVRLRHAVRPSGGLSTGADSRAVAAALNASIQPVGEVVLPELRCLLREPPIEIRSQYTVSELLGRCDEDFVRDTYRALLQRNPESNELASLLAALRCGSLSKIEILRQVVTSPEGRQKHVTVAGLAWRIRRHRVTRFLSQGVPLVRNVVKWVTTLMRLPRTAFMIERLEATFRAYAVDSQHVLREHRAFLEAELNRRFQLLDKNVSAFQSVARRSASLEGRLHDDLAVLRDELLLKVGELDEAVRGDLPRRIDDTRRVAEESAASAAVSRDSVAAIDKRLRPIETGHRDHRLTITEHERQLRLFLDEVRRRMPDPLDSEQLHTFAAEADHQLNAMYVSFEDRFRGPRAEIKRRLADYLGDVAAVVRDKSADLLVDVGSGRGEWLELMHEHGYAVRGVDINSVMVRECHERGLECVQADACEYLRGLTANSVAVVTGFHVIEHLPLTTMVTFLDEALRVLRPGGMAILETPNPENPVVGFCNFYLDPTHRNPIPPPLLTFLLEARGYGRVEIRRMHPLDASPGSMSALPVGFAADSCMFQDYAGIAFKS
jgi:2-polyprenyl-3-methyl-5-hydroxy-6-metoxy-1,4-benzoquinol methylase